MGKRENCVQKSICDHSGRKTGLCPLLCRLVRHIRAFPQRYCEPEWHEKEPEKLELSTYLQDYDSELVVRVITEIHRKRIDSLETTDAWHSHHPSIVKAV